MEKHIPADFDPNAPGINNGCYFGMPFTPEESKLVLFSVPWEVTASYGGGTAQAPDAKSAFPVVAHARLRILQRRTVKKGSLLPPVNRRNTRSFVFSEQISDVRAFQSCAII